MVLEKRMRDVLRDEMDQMFSQVYLVHVWETSVSADTNLFADDIAIRENGYVRIKIISDASVVLRLVWYNAREDASKTGDLNGGSTITAGAWYTFDFPVYDGDTVNLQVSAAAVVTIFVSMVKVII